MDKWCPAWRDIPRPSPNTAAMNSSKAMAMPKIFAPIGARMLTYPVPDCRKERGAASDGDRDATLQCAPVPFNARRRGGTLLCRLLYVREIVRAINQGNVREGLRHVADQPLRHRVVFLGEQPDIVAQREQAIEQRARLD